MNVRDVFRTMLWTLGLLLIFGIAFFLIESPVLR